MVFHPSFSALQYPSLPDLFSMVEPPKRTWPLETGKAWFHDKLKPNSEHPDKNYSSSGHKNHRGCQGHLNISTLSKLKLAPHSHIWSMCTYIWPSKSHHVTLRFEQRDPTLNKVWWWMSFLLYFGICCCTRISKALGMEHSSVKIAAKKKTSKHAFSLHNIGTRICSDFWAHCWRTR